VGLAGKVVEAASREVIPATASTVAVPTAFDVTRDAQGDLWLAGDKRQAATPCCCRKASGEWQVRGTGVVTPTIPGCALVPAGGALLLVDHGACAAVDATGVKVESPSARTCDRGTAWRCPTAPRYWSANPGCGWGRS
jgi:hypothetical protein